MENHKQINKPNKALPLLFRSCHVELSDFRINDAISLHFGSRRREGLFGNESGVSECVCMLANVCAHV